MTGPVAVRPTGSPPRAAAPVAGVWHRLASPLDADERFDPALTAGLPEPARRWLLHAIADGTPLWRAVELRMQGEIRLGRWRPFRARQVLAPGTGFVWAASTRVAGLPVVGYDRYSDGSGEMRWRLGGLLPVMTAAGPDVTRSAAGRLAGEGLLVPTAWHGADWSAGPEPDRATATWTFDGQAERVELHVGPDGALRSAVLSRWGNPLGRPHGRYPFGVELGDERTVGGVTVPTSLRAGWCWGTPDQAAGEFFRARITDITWH